ncbi:DUF4349 domain-containing protein [Nannocystaceae bacterium ST9]
MPTSLLSHLRLLVTGVLLALPLACWQVGVGVAPETNRSELAVAGALLECPIGSEGCPCTAGGGCDPGLTCMAGICSSGEGEVYYGFEEDVSGLDLNLEPAPVVRAVQSETLSVMEMPGVVSRGAGRRDKAEKRKTRDRSFGKDAKEVSVSPTAAPEMGPAPKPAPVSVEGHAAQDQAGELDEPEPDDADDRQIIYTASLSVAVYELDAAIELAESMPLRYGGWIESRYDYQITLRLPADRLFEAIAELSALGLVLGKTLRADDVTAEYTDLEGRILVLEQLVEQLELLLAKAKTVEEALKIRVELERVRIELEAARVRMRQLSELIDFSTLTLYLSARGSEALPSSNDPFPWVDDLGVESTEYR